jgi:hypothetical protein
VKDPSSTNTVTDSTNANFLQNQADHQADHQAIQLRSTPTMDDSVNATHLSLHEVVQQSDAQTPAASITDSAANSVNNSFLRDQADHQSDPELPSTMTSAQTDGHEHAFEAATAATRALGITEILFFVIPEVPLHERTSLRRVSKLWEAVIEEVGHALEPIGYERGVPVHLMESQDRALRPNLHAGLTRSLRRDYESHVAYGQHVRQVDLRLKDLDRLGRHKHEFITDPPITQVYVEATPLDRPESEFATLRVRGGIRVRDLRECFEEVMPSEQFHIRVVSFGVLGQESDDGSDDGTDNSWYIDDYIRAHIGDVSQEKTGGGDTPYASQSEVNSNSQGSGYGGEFDEGGLGSEEPEDGYEWNHRDRLEAYSNDSQGDDGESGEGGLSNDEAEDEHEWSWEAELEKWSKDSQGDHSESREGDWASEEPEYGFEWNSESEQQYCSNLPGNEPRR